MGVKKQYVGGSLSDEITTAQQSCKTRKALELNTKSMHRILPVYRIYQDKKSLGQMENHQAKNAKRTQKLATNLV